jgi:hypothetical protein
VPGAFFAAMAARASSQDEANGILLRERDTCIFGKRETVDIRNPEYINKKLEEVKTKL